jgi:hypothetical protein
MALLREHQYCSIVAEYPHIYEQRKTTFVFQPGYTNLIKRYILENPHQNIYQDPFRIFQSGHVRIINLFRRWNDLSEPNFLDQTILWHLIGKGQLDAIRLILDWLHEYDYPLLNNIHLPSVLSMINDGHINMFKLLVDQKLPCDQIPLECLFNCIQSGYIRMFKYAFQLFHHRISAYIHHELYVYAANHNQLGIVRWLDCNFPQP